MTFVPVIDTAAVMPAVARALLGEPNRGMSTRRDWRYGRKGSLSIDVEAGVFYQHPDGPGGDAIALVQHVRGGDFKAALAFIRDLGGEVAERPAAAPKPRPRRDKSAARAAALRIWAEAVPIDDTPAAAYLGSRGLDAPVTDSLRFHPCCQFGRDDAGRWVHHPCMVALVRDVLTSEPRGIHRTALDANARKIGRKMMGPVEGGAVMLDRLGPTRLLRTGEGIETMLAVRAMEGGPVWAMMDAGRLARMPIRPDLRRLMIYADNDKPDTERALFKGRQPRFPHPGGEGLHDARLLAARARAAGVEVGVRVPLIEDTDFADEWLARCGRVAA